MTVETSVPPARRPGDFVWCTKLHEEDMEVIAWGVERPRRNGPPELVNEYSIFGKERPALVLRETLGERKSFIVWYTCTSHRHGEHAIDVTHITTPAPPKQAFLKAQVGEIRRVPRSTAWCGKFIRRIDPTIFDAFLKEAQRVPFLRPY